MKTKIIVLLLVLSAVLLSGCAEEDQPAPEPEENVTEEETVTPEENVTEEETVTEEEAITPEESVTEEETETPEENVTGEEAETPAPIRTTPYTIRVDNYRATPSSLDIKQGETVAWINFQDRIFTLVSEDGLFENTNLVYRRSFAYTFDETGTYTFTVIGQPKMTVTIDVTEP